MRRGQAEVLAPAGSFESMKAAITAGADAVYIGGSRFGARAYADNLDQERMLEAIDYAHIHGVSLYMTVNTLMKEREMEELLGYLRPFYEQGLDGVIVQDLGAVSFIRDNFPDMPVHASTQMTVTGVYGARILAELGVKRVVTARELSLDEIRQIRKEVPIEIECFVHGALCYCYSGQCLLSSFIGGRSGNRGRCAQPCRLPYETEENRKNRGKSGGRQDKRKGMGKGDVRDDRYILSMKDLCTLDLIPDLIEAGVSSLKIEGRMKSPRYTAGTVRIYRKYTDRFLEKGREGYHVDPKDRQELLELFDRGGFTEGYYRQHNGPDMIARLEKPAFRQGNRELFEELDRLYVETEKKVPIEGLLTVKEGEKASLQLRMADTRKDGDRAVEAAVWGQEVQTARSQPVAREQLARQIKKTGNTLFEFTKLDICMEGQGFLPVQQLNELRRDGLERLKEAVTERYRRTYHGPERTGSRTFQAENREKMTDGERKVGLHVLISSEQALAQILEVPQVSRVIIEADGIRPENWKKLAGQCHARGKSCVLAMPVIFRRQAERYFDSSLSLLKEADFDKILIRSLEEAGYLCSRGVKIPVCGDHNLYSFNSQADRLLKQLGCEETTFPLELNSRELAELGGEDRELIVYGYLPAMVSAQCVTRTVSGCSRKPGRLAMRDRAGKKLYVENHCRYCYNIIYNPSPLSLMGQRERILALAPKAVRIQFTWEPPEEISQIISGWIQELYGEKDGAGTDGYPKGDFTRGHFKRGVE